MGSDRKNSVIDKEQRSWDHPNLFLVGDGVFPSTGTANPDLDHHRADLPGRRCGR